MTLETFQRHLLRELHDTGFEPAFALVATFSGCKDGPLGVHRWGGSPYWMSNYRWGYGWDYLDGMWPRGYKVPTEEEQAQIDAQMPAAREVITRDAELNPVTDDKPVTPAP